MQPTIEWVAAVKDQIHVRTRLAEGMKLILCTSHLEVLFLEDSMAKIQLTVDKVMEVTGLVIWLMFMLGAHIVDILMALAHQETTPPHRMTGKDHGGTVA